MIVPTKTYSLMAFEPADPAMKMQLKIDRKRTTETFTRDSQIDSSRF